MNRGWSWIASRRLVAAGMMAALLPACAGRGQLRGRDGPNDTVAASRPAHTEHYYSECTIIDAESRIVRTFPGWRCLYLDDGSLVSAVDERITYFDRTMRIVWTHGLATHHYLELSLDRKSLYTLGSEVRKARKDGKTVLARYEVLYKIDRKTGRIQSVWRMREHFARLAGLLEAPVKEFKDGLCPVAPITYPGLQPVPNFEWTHFNSVREVPPNAKSRFKPGQIIVNACCAGFVLVFDHELRAPLYAIGLAPGEVTHSANVTAAGDLIFFQNSHGVDQKDGYSSLELYDPVLKKSVWSLNHVEGEPAMSSPNHGYVEELPDGHVLFSTEETAYEIDRGGKVFWHLRTRRHEPFHDLMPIKKGDLSRFLKNNQG